MVSPPIAAEDDKDKEKEEEEDKETEVGRAIMRHLDVGFSTRVYGSDI